MDAFVMSALVVAISEIGDKTQLLSLFLAARFRRPLPIILGIGCATILNHGIAGAVGTWLHDALSPELLRWMLAASFLAIAGWTMLPDKLENETPPAERYGVFVVTLIAFFLAEIGDKTQIATTVLAAKHDALIAVVGGSTLGMLCVDVPSVLVGSALPAAMPLRALRFAGAGLFGALAAASLFGVQLAPA